MQYKTYQEAKIENPESEIYHFKHKNIDAKSFFFTVDDEKDFVAINGTIFKCKPSVFCMTLADFFDAGHKLVKGDTYEDSFGFARTVGLHMDPSTANHRLISDDRRYILRAKALEDKMSEEIKMDMLKYIGLTDFSKEIEGCRKNALSAMEKRAIKDVAKRLEREAARDLPCELEDLVDTLVLAINESVNGGTGENSKKEDAIEWKNGDECVAVNEHGYDLFGEQEARLGKKGVIMALFENNKGIDVASVCYDDGTCICWNIDLIRKTETQEQKLDRQRLKSAYHLACIAGGVDKWGDEFTFDNFKQDKSAANRWLAVVDETRYTKGGGIND